MSVVQHKLIDQSFVCVRPAGYEMYQLTQLLKIRNRI